VKPWDGYARSMRGRFINLDDEQPGYLFRPTRNELRDGLVDLPEAQMRRLSADASDERETARSVEKRQPLSDLNDHGSGSRS